MTDILLVSSSDAPPKRFLTGHAFDGPDLVVGNQGYQEFEQQRGRIVSPGQDGAYVVANKVNHRTVIGTDGTGRYQVYVYRQGRNWAISNSLNSLIDHARAHDFPITIDFAHLSSFFIQPKTIGDQLMSLRTAVQEIRLVPTSAELWIEETLFGRKLLQKGIQRISASGGKANRYGDEIREFVTEWAGRFVTMLEADIQIICQLSASLQDRAVLALLDLASKSLGYQNLDKVYFQNASAAREPDPGILAIAQQIGAKIGIPDAHPAKDAKFSSSEAFDRWRERFPGSFMPVRAPTYGPLPNQFWINGHGGAAYRTNYQAESMDALLDECRRFLPNDEYFDQLRSDVEDDLRTVRSGSEGRLDPLALHFRHFRERFSEGHKTFFRHSVCPLSSHRLRQATCREDSDLAQTSRAMLDIIACCDPTLLQHSFTPETVAATPLQSLLDSKISALDLTALPRGRVFSGGGASFDPGKFSQREFLDILRSNFYTSLHAARSLELFDERYFKAAKKRIDLAIENGRLSNPRDGAALAHTIFAAKLAGD